MPNANSTTMCKTSKWEWKGEREKSMKGERERQAVEEVEKRGVRRKEEATIHIMMIEIV